jgi:hypothetical protein
MRAPKMADELETRPNSGDFASGGGTGWCGAAWGRTNAAFQFDDTHASRRTPVPVCSGSESCEKNIRKISCQLLQLFHNLENSPAPSVCAPRKRTIRRQIIGRGMAVPILGNGVARVGIASRFLAGRRWTIAMLHQPAGQHRCGVFFEPGIEQLRDLFPKIGGMAQPGKFVALQRIARSREKEFPRRLGPVFQGILQRDARANNNRLVNPVKVHPF